MSDAALNVADPFWLRRFNLVFAVPATGLEHFFDKVVPKLQKRGIFRHEDEGRSLQEKLGLPRRKNRFLEG